MLSAQAELAQAGLNLDRTQVAFPYAGRIVESRIEEGLLLIAGQSYGMAYNSSQLEIVAPVAPDDLARLEGAVGRSVDIVFESGETLTGQVIREGADLDNRSRFIDLFIRASDPSSLRPGLFAEILITGETIGEVFRLPPNSVSGLNSAHIVRDGVIEPISVDVIERGHEFIVTRPFDSADGLIISPLPADVDGRVADIQQASPVGVSGSSDGSGASEE